MIVLAIRKADSVVMPLRQDSPAHRPGGMTAATIAAYGGAPEDYFEVAIGPKDTQKVLGAKRLTFKPETGELIVTEYSPEERVYRRKASELALLKAKFEREEMERKRYQELIEEIEHEEKSTNKRPRRKNAHTAGAESRD